MTSRPERGPSRWERAELGGASSSLARALTEVVQAGDLLPLLANIDADDEAAVWAVVAELATHVPARAREAVEALRCGRCDIVLFDGEPERDDLGPTLDGLDRLFSGGLASDWMGLVWAHLLGTTAIEGVGLGQLRLEWQLDGEGLHRDSVRRRIDGADRWSTATFTSLRCIRAGNDPAVETVVAHRNEVFDRLDPCALEWLSRPVFRSPRVVELAPSEWFPLIVRRPEERGWDMNPELVWSQVRLQTLCCDARARPAIDTLLRAYAELDRYPASVRWRPGRRIILAQRDHYHGRRGRILGREWATERWMTRANVLVEDPTAAPKAKGLGASTRSALARLGPAMERDKRAWLATSESLESVATDLGHMLELGALRAAATYDART